jgi:hypothetical protein
VRTGRVSMARGPVGSLIFGSNGNGYHALEAVA